jgi:hypothetical protein
MSFDLLAYMPPTSNDWRGLFETPPATLEKNSHFVAVQLPDGVTIPDDKDARDILLAALFARGILH